MTALALVMLVLGWLRFNHFLGAARAWIQAWGALGQVLHLHTLCWSTLRRLIRKAAHSFQASLARRYPTASRAAIDSKGMWFVPTVLSHFGAEAVEFNRNLDVM